MIIKSPLFPTVIGWLVVLGGVGYLVPAFMKFLDLDGGLISILDYLTMGELIWMIWVMALGAKWKNLETQ